MMTIKYVTMPCSGISKSNRSKIKTAYVQVEIIYWDQYIHIETYRNSTVLVDFSKILYLRNPLYFKINAYQLAIDTAQLLGAESYGDRQALCLLRLAAVFWLQGFSPNSTDCHKNLIKVSPDNFVSDKAPVWQPLSSLRRKMAYILKRRKMFMRSLRLPRLQSIGIAFDSLNQKKKTKIE